MKVRSESDHRVPREKNSSKLWQRPVFHLRSSVADDRNDCGVEYGEAGGDSSPKGP